MEWPRWEGWVTLGGGPPAPCLLRDARFRAQRQGTGGAPALCTPHLLCLPPGNLGSGAGQADLLPLVPQGDYDPSRTKVLHLRMNPASAARQHQHEEHAQLQEECERLRELVRALERGGPVPAGLEATAALPSSKEVTGRPPPLSLTALGRLTQTVCWGPQASIHLSICPVPAARPGGAWTESPGPGRGLVAWGCGSRQELSQGAVDTVAETFQAPETD